MSQEVLITGDNQLYNPLFCNLYSTNNGFITCDNCSLSGASNVTNTSNQSGYQDCLNACQSNSYCTSYNYNSSDGTCTQYQDFPTGINNNVTNSSAGYNISAPFTYDYNNLSSDQQTNTQIKCADQYLNNQYINNNNVELASCLSVSESGSNSVVNADPECVYNIYNQNGLPTNQVYTNSVIQNDQYNLNSTRDSKIDQYQQNYKAYVNSNVQITNIDNLNTTKTSATIDPSYKLLMEQTYDPILRTTPNIVSKIKKNGYGSGMEGFSNVQITKEKLGNNHYIILIFIIIFIIFSILFYNL